MRRYWNRLCVRLGRALSPEARADLLSTADAVFKDLDKRYRSATRHYHNWNHIRRCLGVLHRYIELAEVPMELEAALWFHDAVWEPTNGEWEVQSGNLAYRQLSVMGVTSDTAEKVRNLILCTEYRSAIPHHTGGDCGLLRDIDLSILGEKKRIYNRYERGVRREYKDLEWQHFASRRIALLQRFIDSRPIYFNPILRNKYEEMARRNIERAVSALKKGLKDIL